LYNAFYNLKRDPFRLTPDADFLYMTAHHREAFAGLVYGICTRPGLTVLVGEVGTGKTTLLYALLGVLEKRRFITAMCTNPTLSREEFFDMLLAKFGVPCSSSLKSRQLAALQEAFSRNHAEGRPSVLIVDEAQRLSTELLEEIRLLLNLETPREKLLEIIMAGQPELGEILRRPELRQLKQRVSYFCKLQPLSVEELGEYLYHRLTRAGLPEQNLFSRPVIELIHEYSQGIPRLVNILCDGALRTGMALQSRYVTAAMVQEAAKDVDLAPPLATAETPSYENELAWGDAAASMPPPAPAHSTSDGVRVDRERVPFDGYAARQKSLGFLTGLIDRWK